MQFDEESLNLIAQKADGGMRDALSMFDKAVSFCNSNLQYKAVAQTLNVLDYDTYFSMVDLLLEGDYTEALIRFDEVLSKGFSGQTFMAGLNQHLRDLLLAKGPAISLIELTGTLLDRYRQQAEKCPTEFLFGAIALLTEADGRIKQSSNQRLLVELGLMKIASLGKKKNDDIPLADNYPLPDLPTSFTPVATAVGGASAPAPKAAEPQRVASAPVVENTVERAAEIVAERPAPAPAPAPTPAPAPKPTTARRSALAGFSITSLMGAASAASEAAEATNAESARTEQLHYDPLTEQKIVARREEVVEAILHERPRFIVAFEKMAVEGHTVRVEVPTQQLHDEILRSKTEVLLTIARTAGVEGMIDLEVKVNEQIKASRPIKLEDRIKYMTERAPLLLELKKALDMEYE